ncbi:MAG: hypothetical protein ACOY81_09105 [Bacillota bacterium]
MQKLCKLLALLAVTALAVYLALGFQVLPGMSLAFWSAEEKVVGERVTDKTLLKEQYIYWCGDSHLIYQGELYKQLQGKSLAQIKDIFPAEEGWQVYTDEHGCLHLDRRIDSFCSKHIAYRHLGLQGEKLAVYQGPLGYDQKLLQVLESWNASALPAAWREKVQKAAKFQQLPEEEQQRLREELEFTDEVSLQAALDNLDENSSD